MERARNSEPQPLILFSSQYGLPPTRGASNGRIKNVLKKTRSPPWSREPAGSGGPIMRTEAAAQGDRRRRRETQRERDTPTQRERERERERQRDTHGRREREGGCSYMGSHKGKGTRE